MARADDWALLRRFEPIIRFTRGEQFFPMRIEPYLAECSLWQRRPNRDPELLVEEGDVTPATLAEPRTAPFGTVYFLKFIAPLNLAELAGYRLHRLQEGLTQRDSSQYFRAGRGRLARVGYGSRFVDALFQLSLLARGRVPGDTAAAAALAYERIMRERPHHTYYGRVVRENSWIALQYWFFYPFNNWRSGFSGANDHEADWEMICVYVAEQDTDGSLQPEWVAYGLHDVSGDDLRRRWDDPELEKQGDHPVVYAGAGSHANYFAPGEYLTELELPFLAPLVSAGDRIEAFWRRTLRRYQLREESALESEDGFNFFRIPFVDFARGDGISIGPGTDHPWDEPELLDPAPGWAERYRGLWGLYARDPLSGEDAPAGPAHGRDGTARRAWYDPVGWAGLDKVPPSDASVTYALVQRAEIDADQRKRKEEIEEKSGALTILGVESEAMRDRPYMESYYRAQTNHITTIAAELDRLRKEYAEDEARIDALDRYIERLRSGHIDPPRAHLRRPHRPVSAVSLRFGVFAEIWAAVSIGVMLIAFVALFILAPQYLIWGLAMLFAVFIFIEAGFRRQLPRLVSSVTIALATIAAFVIVFEFFWQIVVALVVAAGAYLMWENLRELWA